MAYSSINQDAFRELLNLDKELSNRFIALDPSGYFLIKIDPSKLELIVEHYENDIDEQGRALDKETGRPLECKNGGQRVPRTIFRGKSAKELGIQLTEGEGPYPLSKLDHALYLGRELQKAERCMLNGLPFIQD